MNKREHYSMNQLNLIIIATISNTTSSCTTIVNDECSFTTIIIMIISWSFHHFIYHQITLHKCLQQQIFVHDTISNYNYDDFTTESIIITHAFITMTCTPTSDLRAFNLRNTISCCLNHFQYAFSSSTFASSSFHKTKCSLKFFFNLFITKNRK